MPVMRRKGWVKLERKGKLLHHMQRFIDRAEALQARYDRSRASGRIKEPIPWLKRK
jgi:hypothetical protein